MPQQVEVTATSRAWVVTLMVPDGNEQDLAKYLMVALDRDCVLRVENGHKLNSVRVLVRPYQVDRLKFELQAFCKAKKLELNLEALNTLQ